MAEDAPDAESKTEDPTPRRREEARRQGRVPFSAELVGSAVLLAGVAGLAYLGPGLWDAMYAVFRHDLRFVPAGDLGPDGAQELFARAVIRALAALLPFLGLLLAVGVGASVAQVGFQLNSEKLEPDFDKLNPANNFGKLFSVGALVRAGLTILKVIALTAVAYVVLEPRFGRVITLGRDAPAGAALAAWAIVTRLAVSLAAAVAGVAALDYAYQRYRFEQALRMTKQEVKDELKSEEGDPQVKARIRQLARERARRRMLAEVPKATVVITNPTHYAVALRYQSGTDDAPVVVAKGVGTIAHSITDLARRHGVPLVERPALARAVYAGVKEGQAIPGPLFRAVAEVLAFVYRLRGVGPQPNPPAG
jgi:flagellar biosynthetic protein FlhB